MHPGIAPFPCGLREKLSPWPHRLSSGHHHYLDPLSELQREGAESREQVRGRTATHLWPQCSPKLSFQCAMAAGESLPERKLWFLAVKMLGKD